MHSYAYVCLYLCCPACLDNGGGGLVSQTAQVLVALHVDVAVLAPVLGPLHRHTQIYTTYRHRTTTIGLEPHPDADKKTNTA